MYTNILVPTDGSPLGIETVRRAVVLAQALGARVTFFHAAEDPSRSLLGDPALLHSIDPDRYAARYEWRRQAVLWKAEAEAQAAAVPFHSVAVIGGPPIAEAILAVAKQHGCDLIFMASHGRSNALSRMLGSVALKVLTHSPLPVLLSDSGIKPPTAMTQALTVMHEEHCTVAALLRGLDYLIGKASEGSQTPDYTVIRAVLTYLNEYGTQLHHPKEEDYLFSRLRARGFERTADLAALCAQHQEERRLLARLDGALAAAQADPATGCDDLLAALADFTRHAWQHMGLEERVVIPAARELLDDNDWQTIAQAFLENGDPRFGTESEADFQRVFAQIVNCFPQPALLDLSKS